MLEFAELVKRERDRQGLRAYDLAHHLKVAPSWVSRMESGGMSNPPTPEHLAGIAEFLKIDPASLLHALGYQPSDNRQIDPEAETMARAVRNWTPAQKKLLWQYIKLVSDSLDAVDPPIDKPETEATGD